VSLTRDELAARVRRMLSDYAMPASATETGDAVTTTWILPDRYIDPLSLKVYMTAGGMVNDVTGSTLYSFEPDNSAIAFTSRPDLDVVLDFTYTYTHWAEEDILWALQDAVYDLAPTFYVTTVLPITATGARRYVITDPSGEPPIYVRRVSVAEDSVTYERLSQASWRVERGELDEATLVFFEDVTGLIAVEYTMRAQPFAAAGDTLADLGLPQRCARSLVLYAAWTLIEQRMIPRMRSDTAVVSQGEGAVTPYMLLQHSARIKALLDLELQRQHMRPQTAIGI